MMNTSCWTSLQSFGGGRTGFYATGGRAPRTTSAQPSGKVSWPTNVQLHLFSRLYVHLPTLMKHTAGSSGRRRGRAVRGSLRSRRRLFTWDGKSGDQLWIDNDRVVHIIKPKCVEHLKPEWHHHAWAAINLPITTHDQRLLAQAKLIIATVNNNILGTHVLLHFDCWLIFRGSVGSLG